jgi:hypothetical protein
MEFRQQRHHKSFSRDLLYRQPAEYREQRHDKWGGGRYHCVDPSNTGFAVGIANNATLNLVAPGPGAGQPFPGVALMDLSAANAGGNPVQQNLNNNSVSFNLKGAIYFRNQILNFSNNVSLAGGCTQIIARIIHFSNNVNVDDNCAGVGITPINIAGNSIVVVE